MEDKRLEYIILYILVGCVGIGIALLIRLSVLKLGFDDFTANIVFLIFIAIAFAFCLSIQLVVKNLMIPLIEKALMKFSFFRERNNITPQSLKIEAIRKEIADEKEKRLHDAIDYTQSVFASYATDEEITRLCEYIHLYANKLSLKDIKPVKINNLLTSLDIYHFGWNIWNHFKTGKQDDIAIFLKLAFSHTLRDAETETIKKHLKDEERKGIIKIQENIVLSKPL